MSLHDYETALRLYRADVPFYALLMAAMLKADTANARTLAVAYPGLHAETQARYDGGGGRIPGDHDYEDVQRRRAAVGLPPT